MRNRIILSLATLWVGAGVCCSFTEKETSDYVGLSEKEKTELQEKNFSYDSITGIGHEPGVTRRDPSDVIRVGNSYYVYYTRTTKHTEGYWGGTIYCAESKDEGYTWKEKGEMLATGKKGAFDSFSIFTPNIIYADGKYYLFYTGVCPTPGTDNKFKNNSTTDITAIGLAVSDSPTGPFKRVSSEPILRVSDKADDFDSYRIDDAALMFRNGKYYLYYKGRSRKYGPAGPAHTEMGVAIAKSPKGPFVKQKRSVMPRSHEVMVWKGEHGGVFALASFASSLEFAPDGIDFTTYPLYMKKKHRPNAPGAFRPDLTDVNAHEGLTWGISMAHYGRDPYLVRFKFTK